MKLKTDIAHWTKKVPNRQWVHEDQKLVDMGSAVPDTILNSRPLSEVHRLDLSLFVIFEEAALRVSGALVRTAPNKEAMNFAAQQTLDEARHREIFMDRLDASCIAQGMGGGVVNQSIKTPPLVRFLEFTDEVIDRGDFVEALTLMNLIFEGMAYPLYAYEQRYWEPIDPYLTSLIKSAFVDETRHIAVGAAIVNKMLEDDPERRVRVKKLCVEATNNMNEVFDYYIRKFVKLFDAVSRIHADLFAGAEFEPGRLITETPYAEQVRSIHESIKKEHGALLMRAGLA